MLKGKPFVKWAGGKEEQKRLADVFKDLIIFNNLIKIL